MKINDVNLTCLTGESGANPAVVRVAFGAKSMDGAMGELLESRSIKGRYNREDDNDGHGK